MAWTSPADIEAKIRRLWDKGRILSAGLAGEALFPLDFPLAGPGAQELSDRFDAVRIWVRDLEAGARVSRGFGYEIRYTEINNRRLGRNSLPTSVLFATEGDALALIGKTKAAERFRSLSSLTLSAFPGLHAWLLKKPLRVLELADRWDRMLAVLRWMVENPLPGIYVRQVDLPGVDTKFIASNAGILTELREALGAGKEDASDSSLSVARSFEARHGFLSKPMLIRFRILDPRLLLMGLSDITAPVAEVARLNLPVRRVFVTENEINGLAFPPVEGGVVFFGLGYGVEVLAALPWLPQEETFYWGDIDTHGFAILDRFRASFPEARSFLMDRETFLAHRACWVEERQPSDAVLRRLTPEEGLLHAELLGNSHGSRLRLEQERIGYSWVRERMPR